MDQKIASQHNAEFVARVRELWNEHTLGPDGKMIFKNKTGEPGEKTPLEISIPGILRKEGWAVTQNSVNGVVHRLSDAERAKGIPEKNRTFIFRGNPVKRGAAVATKRDSKPQRITGPTLPPLSYDIAPTIGDGPSRVRTSFREATDEGCCWPIGKLICGAAPEKRGKPYCADHAKLIYIKLE